MKAILSNLRKKLISIPFGTNPTNEVERHCRLPFPLAAFSIEVDFAGITMAKTI